MRKAEALGIAEREGNEEGMGGERLLAVRSQKAAGRSWLDSVFYQSQQ